MSAAAAIIAANEQYFISYIIVCEYLQIDPRIVYDKALVEKRAELLCISAIGLDQNARKRLKKTLEWFCKNYGRLTGRSYAFAKRCQKNVEKGLLQIFPETVCAVFTPHALTKKNYTFYAEKQNKANKIVLFIIFGVLAVGVVVAALILLL